jgi:hypothetical protein
MGDWWGGISVTDFGEAFNSARVEVVYSNFIEFCILLLVKLVKVIKMCLNETYSKVRIDKNLSDIFPIENGLKQGDV